MLDSNTLEIAKLVVAALTPLTVAFLGYWFSRRLKAAEQESQRRNQLLIDERERERELLREERETQRQSLLEEKQRQREERERRYQPHIEFTIDCHTYGPQNGFLLAEFVIAANNKSLIRHQFKEILLRVRGIERDSPLVSWQGHEPRLHFPDKLFETDIVPDNLNFTFVEPGVKQEFTFVSRIPEKYRFIVARAEFHYDAFTPHSIERAFEIDPGSRRASPGA
jgi:hypothetical protein